MRMPGEEAADPADQLETSSFAVLGLIARFGPMTPYQLKQAMERSLAAFWPIPHAQLYRYPAKLADQGHLIERAEPFGRRRRVFHLTEQGKAALHQWLADPDADPPSTRDAAIVKLALADLAQPDSATTLAGPQARRHREWLQYYRHRLEGLNPSDPDHLSRLRVLELGITIEEAYVAYWSKIADDG